MPTAKEKKQAKAAASLKAATERLETSFLQSIGPESPPKDAAKLLQAMENSMAKGDDKTTSVACEAAARMCSSEQGLFVFLNSNGYETIKAVQDTATLDLEHHASTVAAEVRRRARVWIDAVDPVDFMHLPSVLNMGARFAVEDAACALVVLDALERYARHSINHRAAMLRDRVLTLLCRILAVHRSPELCHETLSVLFVICDIPRGAAGPFLAEALPGKEGLVLAVTETLAQAPLNIRMQLAGLRLLALWSQTELAEVQKALLESDAKETLKTALDNLDKGGFPHAAAWLSAVAEHPLSALSLQPRRKKVTGGSSAPLTGVRCPAGLPST